MARVALNELHYPWVRHLQRYEYVLTRDFVLGKVVADIGCGNTMGTYAISSTAKEVYGIDRTCPVNKDLIIADRSKPNTVHLLKGDIFSFNIKVDVCVAIEVFEHIPKPQRLIKHLASIGEWLFITTPLAEVTGKTANPEHVAEYSAKDFDNIISKEFNIVEKVYQKSTMEICYNALPNGSSFHVGHVVQMAWCRRK